MTLNRDYEQIVVSRVERDPACAKLPVDKAAALVSSGGPDASRLILQDLANATVGFESLAELTDQPGKSLHGRLSSQGDLSIDNLNIIFVAVEVPMRVNFDGGVVELV